MKTRGRLLSLAAVAAVLALFLSPAGAQEEEKKTGWKDTAEFAWVSTSGNSESDTLGFKNVLTRDWEKSNLFVRLGATRVETTDITVFATDDAAGDRKELKDSNLTTEIYYLDGRYNRNISERTFWYVGAGWNRNRPAGIDNRYLGEAGIGNTWIDNDRMLWKTTYGVTYTDQTDVVEVPGATTSFAGLRLGNAFNYKFGGNAEYQNLTIFDYNLDETDDWRVDMINSIAFTMTDMLGLKVSHQVLYDNLPSLVDANLYAAGEDPTTGTPIGTTVVPADDTDMILTVSLVVNF